VVVVYRKTYPVGACRLLARRSRRLVFEFDDAIWLPAPSEPQGLRFAAHFRRRFEEIVAVSGLVVAGNRNLADEISGTRAEVIPTAVDLARFRPATRSGERPGFVVAWVGTGENLGEWESLAPAFRRLIERRAEVRLKVISDREPKPLGLPLEFERWSLEREATCLENTDVGVMPLRDTPWNRGKCSAKALQYMAMGRPAVVSPVGMNREVVAHGVSGFFAETPEQWIARLEELAADRALARRMGDAARASVEERFDLGRVAARVAALLEGLDPARAVAGAGAPELC
jgi:glycosyltransferase involved in cell wall biosynthesis